MIALSDEEMDQVISAAEPLRPEARSEFLAALAAELEQRQHHGPGVVYGIARDLQRRCFDPPDLSGGTAKYG